MHLPVVLSHPRHSGCHCLKNFPHSQHRPLFIQIGLRLPIIRSINRRRWNFRKADWPAFTEATERSIPLIPLNRILVEEAFRRFAGALSKAAHSSIPRGFRPAYIPCFYEECQSLLQQYEESGDTDVADHLIESLDAARKSRWEESVVNMDFSRSSRRSWALVRRLGAAERAPQASHPPVTADAVAAHLVRVAKIPSDRKQSECVRREWRCFLKTCTDNEALSHFTAEEISSALQHMKSGSAPGYDNIHPEFLKNLGPRATLWLSKFLSSVVATNALPKIWRKAKVIAIEKPGKDPSRAENYRPISLLSVCYKLLERLALQRINCQVETLLSPDQAGFRKADLQ